MTLACGGLLLTGCNEGDQTASSGAANPAAADEDDHDHDHEGDHDHGDDHDHDEEGFDDHHLGPHGGHFVTLEPGDVKTEWVILKDTKEIQAFLPEEITAESVALQVTLGDEKLDPFQLAAAEDLGAGAWKLSDGAAFNHVKMTADHDAGVRVDLVAEVDGQTHSATLHHHEH